LFELGLQLAIALPIADCFAKLHQFKNKIN
jgi:hypothetical protein